MGLDRPGVLFRASTLIVVAMLQGKLMALSRFRSRDKAILS